MSQPDQPAAPLIADLVARFVRERSAGRRVSLERLIDDTPDVADREELLRGVLAELAAHGPGGSSDAAGDLHGLMVPEPLPEFDGYHVIEVVGRGGMGVVYEGYHRGTGRRVAIKEMLPAAALRETARRRFEREVELVARLEHPAIAAVIDSGERNGRLFYVMEFVEGLPLDQAFDPGACDPRAALTALAAACDAVDYAHQRGVLHRDLKPSNILFGADGRVRLVDFGLAKAFDPFAEGAFDQTVSSPGQLVGTLAYMSPEQSRGAAHLLSVRSDVYSLGAIAYELVTGELPVPADGPLADTLRFLAEREPRRPSVVRRGLGPDLDALLLKSLEKDPARRYAGAAEFAADLRRYLADEPILARPLSSAARAARWVRRHQAAAAVAGVALLALAALLTERFVTLTAERDRAEQARALAEGRELRAQRASQFLQEALTLADPDVAGGASVPLRGPLDFASERLDEQMPDWPVERAEVRQQLGMLYLGLGLHVEAERELTRSLELLRGHDGPPHELAETLHGLARVQHARSRYDAARPLYWEAFAAAQLDRPDAVLDGRILNDLGWLEKDAGQIEESRRLYGEALKLRTVSGRPLDLAETLNDLAHLHYSQREFTDAEGLFREALELRRAVHGGDEHTEVAATKASLGGVLRGLGRFAEAETLLAQALETRRALLGDDHPATLVSRNELALLWRELGRDAEAVAALRSVLELRRQRDPKHRDTAASTINLALALQSVGQLYEAAALCEQALTLWETVYGETPHQNVAATLRHQASILRRLGQLEPAEAAARAALDECRAAGAAEDSTAAGLARLGLAQVLLDRDAAEAALEEAARAAEALRSSGAAEYWCVFADVLRGAALARLERAADAEALLPGAVARLQALLPETHLLTRDALGYLRDWQTARGDGAADDTTARLTDIEARIQAKLGGT